MEQIPKMGKAEDSRREWRNANQILDADLRVGGWEVSY